MVKQTFTTGQVLTAAQMTSLQATALGGGAASTKTASYVLVAADAGTTVAMNAAGATTITVNTGLFAAGDTVFIQNIGAGVCTITAGTATVNTAGALALPQYDAGILYFTSASAAIFYDYIQVGAASPLTTKGDLYTFSTSDTRLGVGANNTVLTADSAEATGLKWAAPAVTGKTWTLLNSGGTNLTGAQTITVSGISNVEDLMIFINQGSSASAASEIGIRFNGDTGTNYGHTGFSIEASSTYSASNFAFNVNLSNNQLYLAKLSSNAASQMCGGIWVSGCKSTGLKAILGQAGASAGGGNSQNTQGVIGFYSASAAITSVSAHSLTGNFDDGQLWVYGA